MTNIAHERLTALRGLIAGMGLHGYIVPRTDEHLGEYVPPSAERLAWLTGFTGSAGLAVVLADRAVLFTDGRYMLQIADEADGTLWEYAHINRLPPGRWLDALGRDGLRIGYDPMLLDAEALKELCGKWGRPVPVADNPVDRLWTDRPAAPAGPGRLQPDALTGRTAAAKRAAIADTLRRDGQDAVILADPCSVCWLFNIRGSDLAHTPVMLAHALVHADETAILFIEPARLAQDVRSTLGPKVDVVAPNRIETMLTGLRGKRVAVDPARTPLWFAQTIERLGGFPVDAPDPCLLPQACKTGAELDGMRSAHRFDGAALCRFLHWIEIEGIGRTEIEVAERLLAFRMDTGACLGASFDSISAAGPNAALMHYHPKAATAATLRGGQLYLIDSGGQYAAGTTDVTRTVWLGEATPPEPLRAQFTRVLQGHIQLSLAIFPDGTSGHRLDSLARLALWQIGLDFDHGAGHGLGSYLSVHEWPSAFTSRPATEPVQAGMILTNEPGYYEPGSHGIRLENAMEVVAAPVTTQDRPFVRFEPLTLAPFDRRMILPTLLDDTQRRWLDDYHALVRSNLATLVDADTATWLERACRPLTIA